MIKGGEKHEIEAPGDNSTQDESFIFVREVVTKCDDSRDLETEFSDDEGQGSESEEDLTSGRKMLKQLDELTSLVTNARTALDGAQIALDALNRSFVYVHLQERCLPIRPVDVVDFFWNNSGPDTPCTVCGSAFEPDGQPPIRTVSFDISRPERREKLYLRIHNRHLDCLRSGNIKYIAVSHAWHQDIAVANETGRTSPSASTRVLETLLRTLVTVIVELHHGWKAEVWHDYFSVPQWDLATKEKLLVRLPSIFSSACACVVHLDNFSWSHVRRAYYELKGQPGKDFDDIMMAFFKSRWFERMWVVLEYLQCDTVHLMTSDFRIFYYDESPTCGTFTELWRWFSCREGHLVGSKAVDIFSRANLANLRRNRTATLTYAEAFSLLADKKCANYRDRFLALFGLLRPALSYNDTSLSLPPDPVEACRWVAWECLRAGDYSPLLLVPFSRSYREAEVSRSSWLIGHEKMIQLPGNELGPMTFPPEDQKILRENRVRPRLQLVGPVMEIRKAYSFTADDDFPEICRVVDCTLEWQGCGVRTFLAAMRSTYQFDSSHDTGGQGLLHSSDAGISDSEERLLGLLQMLRSSSDQPLKERLGLFSDLVDLLGLEVEKKGFRLGRAGYALCLVFCENCRTASVFRLYLYPGKDTGYPLRLYRIPGLQYGNSYRNGVGLVVSNKRVVGRMLYGIPACGCDVREIVEID